MGHTRLGTIPKSRKWKAVVAQVAGAGGSAGGPGGSSATAEPDVQKVAALTLQAADTALANAIRDPGLRYTFFLLTQLVLASRSDAWLESLAASGINVSSDASVFDLTVELQNAIDDHSMAHGGSTDVGEMAQQAAGEAVLTLVAPTVSTLFGSTGDDLQRAVRQLSTKEGFSQLGQLFFGRFMSRTLNFYLSRITADRAGSGAFRSVHDVAQFDEALRTHCEQSARVVRDFAGSWYSKTEYMEGISLENTSRFMAVALKKLRNELARQWADE